MDGEKLDLCLLLFRNLYGCNFLRPTIHEESTEVCMKTYIFNFFFLSKKAAFFFFRQYAYLTLFYFLWKCLLFFQAKQMHIRKEKHTENMLNVYMIYSLGDRHNHEKKNLFCAKNVKKKETNIFYYHWISVNPVKNSNTSNLVKWWRVNILLLILFF